MFGQVVYHLLAAHHIDPAPWPVVVLVSCMPVAVVGLAAALIHLRKLPDETEVTAKELTVARSVPSTVFEAAKASMKATADAGNPYSRNQLQAIWKLSRADADEIWQPYKSPPAGVPPMAPAGVYPNGSSAHG